MHDLLKRTERRAVSERLAENPIYIVLRAPCSEWQTTLGWLSPEDVTLECFRVIDLAKEDLERAGERLFSLWSDIFSELSDLSPDGTTRDDTALATDVIYYAILLVVSHARSPYVFKLFDQLLRQWSKHADAHRYLQMIESFEPSAERFGSDTLALAVDAYMESDEFLSDELDDKLSRLNAGNTGQQPAAPHMAIYGTTTVIQSPGATTYVQKDLPDTSKLITDGNA